MVQSEPLRSIRLPNFIRNELGKSVIDFYVSELEIFLKNVLSVSDYKNMPLIKYFVNWLLLWLLPDSFDLAPTTLSLTRLLHQFWVCLVHLAVPRRDRFQALGLQLGLEPLRNTGFFFVKWYLVTLFL